MQEHQVTVARQRYKLDPPFFVLATQNPLEMEGTYPLPEAQLDRFLFKVMVPFPSEDDLVAIMDRTTGAEAVSAQKVCTAAEIVEMQRLARAVPIAPHVTAYAVSLLAATHPDNGRAPGLVRDYVRYGGSPRGAQALVTAGKIYALLDGRFNVSTDDIRAVALPSLRHRIILNFEGEAEGITSESAIRAVLDAVSVPTVE
jgi:MoxR-like ATPase